MLPHPCVLPWTRCQCWGGCEGTRMAPALILWPPLAGISLVPILVVSKKGYALGYLGICGFSGEAQH